MADIHKYRFIMTGGNYYEGYDRIFGKKNEKNKSGSQQKVSKKNRRARKTQRKVAKADV